MTDMWQDPDFFELTDEAWASYVRRQLRGTDGDADSAPPVAQRDTKPSPAVVQPRIDRSPTSQPLPALLACLEFAPTCQVKTCQEDAAVFVSWHPVGRCRHPVYRAEGMRQHLLVCDDHLEAYERKAEIVVAEMSPPWFVRFFKDAKKVCPSCGRLVQSPSDVLEVVISL